jgi:hypothetical protein
MQRTCKVSVCVTTVVSITYAERVSLVFGIQHAMRMRRIVKFGLTGSKIF